ncbi:MAG TPA: ABC transporter ATP-binding protein [Spirochaetota bacterium]|nr:ABC transporter ATP-binding protein [Spirochaetota bacterium]
MIHARDISKTFGKTRAVADLSFSVRGGEIFGIVGPDGAGKSTLLRMVAGILPPDSGSIEVGGVDVAGDPFLIKENLAYMPQRFGLYEDLTVEENIHFFGRVFGVSRREIREREKGLYEFSRLGPFRDRLAGKLSGGMKQKLGLACCLVHRPGLILLDEPTNGVDPVSRREFWKILYGLLAGGVTIVVSTAYLDEAERCNRVALMYEGRFVVTGSPTEIKAGIGRVLVEIRPSDVWKAEAVLLESGEFASIIREGNALRFFVDDAGRAGKRIKAALSRRGIRAGAAETKVPTLENCFMEIISKGAKR